MMEPAEPNFEEKHHDRGFIFLALVLAAEFVFTMVVNALAGGAGVKIGWFQNTTGDISDYYYLEITPNGWAFSIWGIIYTWLLIGIILILVSICIKNESGPAYLNPPVISKLFLVLYILDLAFNIAWLFLWDREVFAASFVVFLCYDIVLYAMLVDNHRIVENNLKYLQQKYRVTLILNRVIIQNGIALHGTWITIATLLNLATLVTYSRPRGNHEEMQSATCTVSLAILTAEVLVFFVLEHTLWEKYLRYTFTVWPVVIWALSASIDKNWDSEHSVNSIFSAVLLAVAVLFFIVKIALSVVRSRRTSYMML